MTVLRGFDPVLLKTLLSDLLVNGQVTERFGSEYEPIT